MKIQLKNYSALFLLFVVLLSGGCKKKESPPTDAQVVLSPAEIMINDDETGKLFLSVQPAYEFEWNVTDKPDWLEINPSSGTIGSDIVELELTPNPTGLEEGKYYGEIEIITNGAGKDRVDVDLCVNAHPVAKVVPTQISFAENETEKTITVSNTGTGYLIFELQALPSWVTASNRFGTLDENEEMEIVLTAQRTGLAAGTLNGQALVSSNSEEGDVNIDFTLEIVETALLAVSESSINFGYFNSEYTFFIANTGNVNSDWSFDNNTNAFISLNPDSGNLAVGDSVEVTMTIDRANLVTQTYNLEVVLDMEAGQPFSLPVEISHIQDEKWLIEGKVIDAEFDRNNDELIIVSEEPNEIRKFNFANNSVESLALNIPPTCVSVGLDGTHAAVGHNGSFSYVNLETMELDNYFAVTTNAFDIVLAPNGWVYVFPEEDQWERIRCVRLSTGVETEHVGNSIREQTKVKLHPSGDYIYGADNGLSPSDFEKYDITGGTAQYLYDSPYHGTYAFSGDIWIAEDGSRLFAKSRNVFNASTNVSNDMTYNGELVGENQVKTLDFSSAAGKVYAVFTVGSTWSGTPATEVRKYDAEFLAFEGTVALPDFLIPAGNDIEFHPSQGHFGFFNTAGTKFHVVVKAQDGSGLQNEWAIATIDVE